MITTVEEFLDAINHGADPHDTFEEMTDASVREAIYALGGNSSEPFRAGMEKLGYII